MGAARLAAAALVAALASGVAPAQTPAREVEVRRPDGTVVLPMPPDDRGRVQQPRANSAVNADDLERRRQQAEQQRWDRAEQTRIERDAARQSPARQITPTQGR
jgi:hypothetical protein